MPDGTLGPSVHNFWPVSFQVWHSSMPMVMLGAFGMRPLTRVPNSSPSQARFKKSTPMSQSCNLFYGGLRKRHPRALGFDFDLNLGIDGPCDGFDGAC
jgi:hypothetical protein